uniref:Secreted protein n=1 Tax=Anguilla anguilla TaxID=7936 RepID=A0A0E9WRJ3_ANGAN
MQSVQCVKIVLLRRYFRYLLFLVSVEAVDTEVPFKRKVGFNVKAPSHFYYECALSHKAFLLKQTAC